MTQHNNQHSGLNNEVDKQVKEAKREWRHLLKFKNENHLIFLAFIVLLTSLVVINAVYIIHNSNSKDSKSQISDSSKILTSNQAGVNKAQKVSISKVTENDKKDYAFTLLPTETMLIMDISITNLTDELQSLVPASQFYVRNSLGESSTLHPSMYITNPLQATNLTPGQTATGQVSFNVSKREAKPLVYIDTGWGNYAPMVFDALH